jgi:AcrR family transcriptional regulator
MARSATATVTGERRRTEILDAALLCFDRRGISATTVEDIRAESGASIGSIYHQFASKDEILSAIYCQAVAAYGDGLIEALRSRQESRAGLQAAVAFHVAWIDAHRALARIMLHWDESELSEAGRALLNEEAWRFAGELDRWLQEGVTEGRLRPLPAELAASLFLGPLLEYGRRLVHHLTSHPVDESGRGLAEGIWRALATGPGTNDAAA